MSNKVVHFEIPCDNPEKTMSFFEKEISGVGKSTAEQLKVISQTSCKALSNMGPQI